MNTAVLIDPRQISTVPSPFESVGLINTLAGNNPTADWTHLDAQFKVITGEYKELTDALERRDIEELRDAAADVLVTVYGLQFRLGVNGDDDLATVTDSLKTRFDETIEDALKTRDKYTLRSVQTETRQILLGDEKFYATISSVDQVDRTNSEKIPKGKFLKAHGYSLPVLDQLAEGVVLGLNDSVGKAKPTAQATVENVLGERLRARIAYLEELLTDNSVDYV